MSGLLLGGQIGYSFGESHALKHIVPHELAKISVVVRKLPRTAEQSGVVLEVVVQNLTDSMQHVTQTDIEHTLMGPDEIVLADPSFSSTWSFDTGSPESTWTTYEHGSLLLRPGQTRTFRLVTSVAHEAERTGRVSVWTKSAVFGVPVRLTGDESSTSDDSEG